MQVPRFSPRISLIEMAPHKAPHSGCPALPCPAPALPCLSPQIGNGLHREWASQAFQTTMLFPMGGSAAET